ncbi:MAG: Histidine kinase [Parcubacteria group bacterium GW2011_GWC1_38_6]|nr:MAG: Histidine kinase [Parcubacteria group bacterium GW2011_GWA1_36_12]KKQ77500.1 MAG: Histidine kinase [Parcubacteria group bacterium GW2011_GWC1_38_6]
MSPSLFFNLQNIDLLLVALAVAGIGVLGFSVFFNNRQSVTNFYFFLFSIATIVWSSVNYLAYRVSNPETSFWLFRLVIFIATWHSFLFFQTFFVFPESSVKFPRWYRFILFPLVALVSIMNLTSLVFSEIGEISSTGQVVKIENGPGIALFGSLIAFLIVGGLVMLFRKMMKSRVEDRKRYSFVLMGVFITFILIMIFNFILPAFFDNPRFIPLGALFIFPFVAFTSYAILKHKLFNIRVAGTAVLVFLLSIVTFFEVIFAGDLALIIYRGSIFILVLSFGIMLIRGVLREVEQRERLAELNKQLEIAYQEVEKLSKAKSEFISIASHQLRTPLTAIKGYISMIIEGSYGKFAEKAKKPLENVYKSNERLVNLVNDLLSISRIESGKMKFEPEIGSIVEIIDGVIFDLTLNAEKKGLYLKFEKPSTPIPEMMLDKAKTRDIVLNLVDNAIKYTPTGGIIVSTKILDSKFQVLIRDTGEGMEKDEMDKIFESFSRGTVGVKAFTEGAGLGLYIARKYAEMHGGRVWAESEGKGKGSTFFVELPVK